MPECDQRHRVAGGLAESSVERRGDHGRSGVWVRWFLLNGDGSPGLESIGVDFDLGGRILQVSSAGFLRVSTLLDPKARRAGGESDHQDCDESRSPSRWFERRVALRALDLVDVQGRPAGGALFGSHSWQSCHRIVD